MNKPKYDAGLSVRRQVMGDEFVDQALKCTTEFTRPMQELVTENCWGEVWTREGLDKKTRSMITLALLTALKAPNELKGHVRGALRNGCTASEIQEVLLHAAVYCGVPAGIEAFRSAHEVIKAWSGEND